ncbi:MAG: hypothetical protein ACREMW_01970 [Gemmatimonadales bacterium]
MALALTLWVLVIGAAVLTVAVFIGFQEQRAATVGRRLHRALTRAESGLAGALSGWTPGVLSRRLPQPFDSVVIRGAGATADDDWVGAIHRLGRGLFLVEVTAADAPSAGAQIMATRARLGWLVRARPLKVAASAALSIGESAIVGTGSTLDGRDQPPADRSDCPPPDSAIPGLAAGLVTTTGSPLIEGSPPTVTRQGGDTGLAVEDQRAFDQLASQATISLPGGAWATGPVVDGTDCDVASPYNWGDPSSQDGPCSRYLPIVHVQGDLTLTAGKGQGILLVDGNLAIGGGYRFHGLVLVGGILEVESALAGVTVWGAVAAARTGSETRPLTGITVIYSKCMMLQALQSSGTLVPLNSRAWKQHF